MARLAELLQVGPHGLGGQAGLPQRGDRRLRVGALRELRPFRPEYEPVVDELRRLGPEGGEELALERLVVAVVAAADDVRDPEVDVVDDARKVVGGRAVRAQERAAAKEQRAGLVGLGRRRSRQPPPGACLPGRSAAAAPRPTSRRASAGPRRSRRRRRARRGLRSVSSIRSRNQSPRRRFASADSALPRCSEPVGEGAKRVRAHTANLAPRGAPACASDLREPHLLEELRTLRIEVVLRPRPVSTRKRALTSFARA